MSVSMYKYGCEYVAVLTGQPQDAVEIGLGTTPARAEAALEATGMQSVGPDCGEARALRWAVSNNWIDSVDDLERI